MKILLLLVLATSSLADENAAADSPWQSLFDGETLAGWVNGKGEPISEQDWIAEEGVLTCKSKGSGSLISKREFGDFELQFDWKITARGNSGLKYRLAKFGDRWLGLEYQILDDEGHPDATNGPIRQSAALYDLKPAADDKPLKAVGEWNRGRIVVKEGVVTHFLNGQEVMKLVIPSPEWDERFAKSKYAKKQGFGVNERGKLMLQDHGDVVSYRNLRIREF